MDNLQLIRELFLSPFSKSYLHNKPLEPNNASIWRFLKSWQESQTLGADEAVLFRQAVRWELNGANIPNIPIKFRNFLKNSSVEVDASDIVNANPFLPKWLQNDLLPENGIDQPPIYRQDIRRFSAEHYLKILQQRQPNGDLNGFQNWKSLAQKEGTWLTLTAEKGSTNLIVLPTGMGKSLCFQLLPLFTNGLTIVVVPTVALAIDQCMHAIEVFSKKTDVNPQYFASHDADVQSNQVIDLINQGRTRLVFTSPEACVSGRLNHCLDNAARRGILQNLVIDEVHIVSSWGMYFRVDFQLLSGLRKKWLSDTQGEMRTFLFTATITPDQKTDILKLFSENDSKQNEFCFHSLRPEISYYNQTFENQSDQQSALTDCLWHLPRPAILYSTEVEMAENFYNIATSLGFRRVGCFTGETKPKERKNLLERWRFDQIDLMIATSAFGLGVDKPDVRSVIHCCFPEDIHRFYQEVGRGGRDGYSSVSILIPTKKDIRVAENMKPKLLSLELVQERWQSLWETRNEVNISEHSWKIRLNSNRPELLGDRTYQENIKWNKRLILQLARAQQILIQDLSFDTDESGKFEDYQEYLTIRLLDGVNPDSPTFGESIKEQRGIESKSVEQGFQYLLDYLSADRCISMTLKKVFGEETYRSCGGCKWCRKEGRNPGDAPVFEYDNRNATKQVRVVGICEHPLDGNKKVFIKTIRKLYDSGIRRYSCNANVFNHLLDLFNVALGNNNLFRLDIVDEGLDLLNPEPVVVFHTNAPTISAIKICGASQVTHVLCGSLSYENIRYLLDSSFRNYEYFSKFDLLN